MARMQPANVAQMTVCASLIASSGVRLAFACEIFGMVFRSQAAQLNIGAA